MADDKAGPFGTGDTAHKPLKQTLKETIPGTVEHEAAFGGEPLRTDYHGTHTGAHGPTGERIKSHIPGTKAYQERKEREGITEDCSMYERVKAEGSETGAAMPGIEAHEKRPGPPNNYGLTAAGGALGGGSVTAGGSERPLTQQVLQHIPGTRAHAAKGT